MHQRARCYDPKTGEFICEDPLEYVDGMSMYRGYFVPNGMDPNGLSQIGVSVVFVDFTDPGPNANGKSHFGPCAKCYGELGAATVDLREHCDLDPGDNIGPNKPICISKAVFVDHGYPGGTCQLGGKIGFSSEQVKNLCDSLCDKAEVYLFACSAGQTPSAKSSSANKLLSECKKIKKVYGCLGDTKYTIPTNPKCVGGIIEITNGGGKNTKITCWNDLLKKIH